MVSLREPAHRGQLFLGKKESCSHEEGRTPADAAGGPPRPGPHRSGCGAPRLQTPGSSCRRKAGGLGDGYPGTVAWPHGDSQLCSARLPEVPVGPAPAAPRQGTGARGAPYSLPPLAPHPHPPAASLRPPPRMTHPRTVSGSASGVSNHDRVKGEGQRPERPGPLPFSS